MILSWQLDMIVKEHEFQTSPSTSSLHTYPKHHGQFSLHALFETNKRGKEGERKTMHVKLRAQILRY